MTTSPEDEETKRLHQAVRRIEQRNAGLAARLAAKVRGTIEQMRSNEAGLEEELEPREAYEEEDTQP